MAGAGFGGRPPARTRGVSLGAMVSTRSLLDIVDSPAAETAGTPGSALSAKNAVINGELKRSLIECSWRLLMAGLVSHLVTKPIRICFPVINPLMSGDPSALVEKLMIDSFIPAVLPFSNWRCLLA